MRMGSPEIGVTSPSAPSTLPIGEGSMAKIPVFSHLCQAEEWPRLRANHKHRPPVSTTKFE